MFHKIKKLFRYIIAGKADVECGHVLKTVDIVGEWKGPVKHPSLMMEHKVDVQPFARVSVCFICQHSRVDFGMNLRDSQPTLPGLSEGESDLREWKRKPTCAK